MRSYLNKTSLYPGQIQFSPPALGIPSNQWIIPVGVGVRGKHGKFLGSIVSGISLDRLARKLELTFNRRDLVFMLFDENLNFVLSSHNVGFSHTHILPPTKLLEQIKENILSTKESKSLLSDPIEYSKFRFNYFKHADQYPFYFVIGEDIKMANAEYWQITVPRIAELTFMGILFIILLYYFRKHIVKPIIILSDSARKIAEGNMMVKIPYGQYDEVNFLASQLQEIQNTKTQLINAKNNVDSINSNLEHKVKERTVELEKALAVKTEFLNNISHEVRTPVQGITSIAQGLVEDWKIHNDKKKYALASAVASNSQRLFSLVSNLLDFSLFNSGKMYFNLQNADLVALIKEIIMECDSLYINNKPIKIILDKLPKTATLLMDVERISQILRNILTNSIKFMYDEGNIFITITNTTIKNNSHDNIPAYMITIKDEGISIPENELVEIFTPFTQSSNTKDKINGAGLGLAICKNIIEGHNGKIWARNNPKKGVSINFTLPITQQQEEIMETTNKTPKIPNNKLINILMIDDEPTCQMSMDILLSNTNYHLISAYGGVAGLEYLSENFQNIDLVFLDLMMPDMYGLNVLTEMKAKPETANMPVIIQSGTNDNKEIEKALALGAQAYVRKPYKKQQILDLIASFI
jgi:two-component system sensor histidine kinase ChiS